MNIGPFQDLLRHRYEYFSLADHSIKIRFELTFLNLKKQSTGNVHNFFFNSKELDQLLFYLDCL